MIDLSDWLSIGRRANPVPRAIFEGSPADGVPRRLSDNPTPVAGSTERGLPPSTVGPRTRQPNAAGHRRPCRGKTTISPPRAQALADRAAGYDRCDPLPHGNRRIYPSRSWPPARLAPARIRHPDEEASPHDENSLAAASRVEHSGGSADRAAASAWTKVRGVRRSVWGNVFSIRHGIQLTGSAMGRQVIPSSHRNPKIGSRWVSKSASIWWRASTDARASACPTQKAHAVIHAIVENQFALGDELR